MSDIIWSGVASDTGTAPTRDFLVQHDQGEVPCALWLPAGALPKGLILVGHGGSRHKREITNLTFIEEAVERNGFAVAAIDGPLHGARRGDRSPDPSDIQRDFLDLWQLPGNGIASMLADWQAALAVLLNELKDKGLPIGYFGLSMGTAYGLPLVAADKRVGAAVIGMWGANYPNSDVLVRAAGEVSCPVLFMHKSDDHFFTLEGALKIYNAIPGGDKRLLMNSGAHGEATSEQIQTALTFFTERLETT
jgi:dienelactone hydrolase